MYSQALALLAVAAIVAMPSSRMVAAPAAQVSEISDADLVRLSRGATVRVGSAARARETSAIPLEGYVAQVLAAEGEPNAPDAAEQALAVAARTYARFNAGRHQKDGYDLCDTTHCQVLRASTPATRRAAAATAGLVLTYQGAPADLYYSASCGGRTERASDVWPTVSLPYLESVQDDVHEADVTWTLERTLDEIRQALGRVGVRGRRLDDVVIESRTASGRVGRVGLPGLDPGSMNSNDFRLALGSTDLRSTAFTLTRSGDRLTFTGKGYGHGVGMCVIGAGRRAARGEAAEAILARYYPGLALDDVSKVRSSVAPRETVLSLLVPPALPTSKASAPVAPPASPAPLVPKAPPPVAPAASAPKAAAPAAVPPVRGLVPSDSRVTAADLQRLAGQAELRLAGRLGIPPSPLTVRLHDSLESFRRATGQPWWVSALVRPGEIDLAPAAVLEQRDGLERALERSVAEVLMAPALDRRPAWVRVGGARYFTRRGDTTPRDGRVRCPADAELTAAVSASSQREAEARAEACFAQALLRSGDWRGVR